MKKKLIIIFSLFYFLTYAQNTQLDSLKIQLKQAQTPQDSLRILDQIYRHNQHKEQAEKLKELNKLRLNIATRINNQIEIIKIYKDMGVLISLENKYDEAKKLLNTALIKSKEIGNDTLYLDNLNTLAGFYVREFKNDSTKLLIQTALKTYEGKIETKILSALHSNLGIAYEQSGEEKKAIEEYIKALEYAEKYNDYRNQAVSLYNIGYIYNLLKQPDDAISYLNKSIKISTTHHIYDFKNYATEQLGYAYSLKENYPKSIQYYIQAMQMFKKANNLPYLTLTKRNLAEIYNIIGEPQKALILAKEAYQSAKKIKNQFLLDGATQVLIQTYIKLKEYDKAEKFLKEFSKDKNISKLDISSKIAFYNNYFEIYKNKKNYKKALTYYIKADKLEDSLAFNEKQLAIKKIEKKYQTEKKDKEILELKNQQAEKELALNKTRQEKILLGVGLGASILFLGIFSFYYRRNQKQKKLIERLQKELHHRIKNNLATIAALINEIKRKYANNPQLKQDLSDLNIRIKSINEIHRQLYKKADVSNLNMKKYVDKLSVIIQESFGNKNIEIVNQIDPDIKLNSNKSMIIGLLINEFITNSFKHAFTDRKNGKVLIKLYKNDKNYVLSMSDNGKGLPDNFNLNTVRTFGMDIMQLLTQQLKGNLKLDGKDGLKVEIIFPEN